MAELRSAQEQVSEVLVGQAELVSHLLITALANGHCLLEGVPGVAKTLAARTFATVLGSDFARIQFTPDLVPADIVGTRIYRVGQEQFDTELGPVFAHCILADEINRAPAKVQATMLELMAEGQVTLGGTTYPLPQPFIVIATQNPLESEGVYPLPEAQRDRFLLKSVVPLPGYNDETRILQRMAGGCPQAQPVLTPQTLAQAQQFTQELYIHPLVSDYIVRLVMATRCQDGHGDDYLRHTLAAGVSPRATLGLLAASKARAALTGRDYVLPEDVQQLATPVLAHRLLLTFDALADGTSPDAVVNHILQLVPEPTRVEPTPV